MAAVSPLMDLLKYEPELRPHLKAPDALERLGAWLESGAQPPELADRIRLLTELGRRKRPQGLFHWALAGTPSLRVAALGALTGLCESRSLERVPLPREQTLSQVVLALVEGDDPISGGEAIRLLGAIGPVGVERALQLLASAQPAVRARAAEVVADAFKAEANQLSRTGDANGRERARTRIRTTLASMREALVREVVRDAELSLGRALTRMVVELHAERPFLDRPLVDELTNSQRKLLERRHLAKQIPEWRKLVRL